MSNQPNQPHSQPDRGLELARRYSALTLAMQLAAREENVSDFEALLHERDRVLDELEALTELSPDALREMNVCTMLGDSLQAEVRTRQEATVVNLVSSFKGRQGREAYRTNGRSKDPTEYREAG